MQQHTSLARLPQSSWARVLLLLLGVSILWQFALGSQMNLLWLISLVITIIVIANTFENHQQQIHILQQQVFDLQKQMNHPSIPEMTETGDTSDLHINSHIQASTAGQEQTIYPPDWMTGTTDHEQSLSSVNSGFHSQSDTQESQLQRPDIQYNPEQHQSDHTLKELKVMTSLWDAMINWFKGGNSIVRIAVVILLIGVVLLLRFASEYWQLTLSAKMAGIAVGGFALTGLGYILRQKRFDYAISLQGAGLGIVFLVLFSSYRLGVIESIALSYGALILLLAGTLLLALRQNALILAFIALGSGFIAPFILNTGSNNIPALMAYYFVLNTALAIIAYFKPWRILNTVALLITFGIGGFAIWFNARPEQYFQISCWVWAIFALYLFISIRYSQHIVELKTQFKDIPFIDTTLIFATPFMAFSLYAGLVYSDGHALSIASAILAVVYLVMGYILHKRAQQLSILSQCFYGLGFVFTALILPFAFDAYWTSVGWAIHGFVVLWLGWRYSIGNARYFGTVLLLASGMATLLACLLDHQQVLFASSLLMVAYAISAYLLKKPYTIQIYSGDLAQVFAWLFIFLSFCITPYVYKHTLTWVDGQMYAISLSLLLWFIFLSLLYWWKDRKLMLDWSVVALLILSFTAIDSLITQVLYEHEGLIYDVAAGQKVELTLTSILWLAGLMILFKSAMFHQSKTLSFTQMFVSRLYATLAILFMAVLGGLWSSLQAFPYMLAVLPILILVASLYLPSFKSLQQYWMMNIGVIALGLVWLLQISAQHTGQWALPYLLILNPVDLTSIMVFALVAYATKNYLLSRHREIQLISAAALLFSGLFLISSLMLRMLHHYADLPYWSDQAWNNSIVQACLTILWAVVALILTTLASRQSWRYIWMLGIAVLAIVIVKLIFLDLSHSHTLTRIVSFIGSGLIMLVIGYFSPLPPKITQQERTPE